MMKQSKILSSRKKAFSLMEVIISVVILSVVMITLLQIKSDNIFMISKSEERIKATDYILLAINFEDSILDKNQKISLEDKFDYKNEKINEELKNKKIEIKDDKLDDQTVINGNNNLNIFTSFRTFTLEDSNIKKKIYSFRFEL